MTPAAPAAPAAAPLRWQQAIIERIVARTPRVASVFVRSALAAHEAGQHVDVRLTAPDGYQAQRSYSIASPPGSSSIELAIERLADGEVSPYFHDVARPGDAFEMRGPIGGHFVWRRDDGGPLAMIAGGSGVVPLAAMLRHRAAVASGTPTLLVYSSRTWDDIVFRDELVAMQSSDPSFRLVLITTREPRPRGGLRPQIRPHAAAARARRLGPRAETRLRLRLERLRRGGRVEPRARGRRGCPRSHRALRRALSRAGSRRAPPYTAADGRPICRTRRRCNNPGACPRFADAPTKERSCPATPDDCAGC